MKSILLAAAALLASPVIAQTTPPADPAAQTAPADPAMQTAPADQAAPADPAAPAAPADQAMAAPADPAAAPAAPMAPPAPAGGVTFGQPTVTPPTPAPAEYPVCSKTVKDGCRNRGGK
ncbi:MAG: hypothetical protein EOP67_13405 [Sphingomonas sp.]|nr:MAG: hypothetical protein EOP67_13405 [Sphingomonas sp.]